MGQVNEPTYRVADKTNIMQLLGTGSKKKEKKKKTETLKKKEISKMWQKKLLVNLGIKEKKTFSKLV